MKLLGKISQSKVALNRGNLLLGFWFVRNFELLAFSNTVKTDSIEYSFILACKCFFLCGVIALMLGKFSQLLNFTNMVSQGIFFVELLFFFAIVNKLLINRLPTLT